MSTDSRQRSEAERGTPESWMSALEERDKKNARLLAEVEQLKTEKAALKETLQKVFAGRCAELERCRAKVESLTDEMRRLRRGECVCKYPLWNDVGSCSRCGCLRAAPEDGEGE